MNPHLGFVGGVTTHKLSSSLGLLPTFLELEK